jgi:hypothetical protein
VVKQIPPLSVVAIAGLIGRSLASLAGTSSI